MQKKLELPKEGILETPIQEDVFNLLAKRITQYVDIECLIHLKESKARIKVRVTSIIAPGCSDFTLKIEQSSSDFMESNQADGFHRASNKIQEKLMKSSWLLYGFTSDSAQRPICILILPGIMTSYAFKNDNETLKAFNPVLN